MTGFKIEDLIEEKGQAFQIFVKKCPKCGKEFETLKAEQIYCSAECREQALAEFENTERERSEMAEKQGFVSRICANPDCGRKFMPKTARQLYCSAECSKHKPPMHETVPTPAPVEETKTKEKVCPVCGKTFVAYHNRQIYCSGECHSKGYKNICQVCGKEFFAGTKGLLYCSRDCRDKLEIEKICPVCGEKFVTNQKKQIYCSYRCAHRKANIKSRNKKKVCPVCGKEFLGVRNEQKYCSLACASKNKKPYSSRIVLEAIPTPEPPQPEAVPTPTPAPEPPTPEVVTIPAPVEETKTKEKVCPVCGKEFVTSHYRQIYCSIDCSNNVRFEKICPVCGETFVANKRTIYCSEKCYKIAYRRAGKIKKECPVCGKEFLTYRNEQKYCSRACAVKNMWSKYKPTTEPAPTPEPPQPEAVPTPAPVEKTKIKKNVCPICNKEFESRRVDCIYCSNACKTKAYRQRNKHKPTFWQKITNFVRRIFKGNR